MTTFILVHGMWHGGWCWDRVAAELRVAGHIAYLPTLAGLAERAHSRSDEIDLNTHVHEVVNICVSNDLHEVILVGHSSGGFMAHVVADKIPERGRAHCQSRWDGSRKRQIAGRPDRRDVGFLQEESSRKWGRVALPAHSGVDVRRLWGGT